MIPLKERVKSAEEQTNTDPTDGQKVSGNYKKGKFTIKGLKISIENPAGSIRRGIDQDGKEWKIKMPYSYGYFNKTLGRDSDPVDVFLGPIIDQEFDVFIVDQVDEKTKSFDEHKIMFGFKGEESAKRAYLKSYTAGWRGFGNVTRVNLKEFKSWLNNKSMIKNPAGRMKKKISYMNVVKDRVQYIKLIGAVEEEATLEDLKKQAGNPDLFDKMILEIASPGGSVAEGLSIMVWLDSLSQSGKEIITVVTANAYSIASLIMLAADIKIVSRHAKVMVHNPMVPELKYANADELEKYASELRDLEAIMYELYQIFTGLSKEQIKALMDNETYLIPQEAVDNGFADIVLDVKPRPYEMVVNNKKEINMSKTLNILNRVIHMVGRTEFVNQLYYDKEGGEIEISQNDPSTYAVGDRTSVKDGEVVLSDGAKLMIEESLIKTIDKSVEEVAPDAVEEVIEDTPLEEVVTAEEEIIPPVVETAKRKDDMPSTVVETTESIKTTKETVALADPEKEVVAIKEEKEVVAIDPEKEVVAEFNEGPSPKEVEIKAEEVEKEVVAIEEEKEVVAAEIEVEAIDPKKEVVAMDMDSMYQLLMDLKSLVEGLTEKSTAAAEETEKLKEFETLATEAIDALAQNTTSSFSPVSRKASATPPSGSIFKRAKQARGL